MVNRNIFKQTYQLFDQDVIIEIINIYNDEYPEKLRKLAQSIKDRNFKELRFIAHNLKGVIANFSAPEALEIMKSFEITASQLLEEGANNVAAATLETQLAEVNATAIKIGKDLEKIKQEILSGDFIIDPAD